MTVSKEKIKGTKLGQYMDLLFRVARGCSKIYGVPYEDCEAKAFEVYAAALTAFNEKKNKEGFLTFLCNRLNGIHDYYRDALKDVV